jgi:hypothetical protein
MRIGARQAARPQQRTQRFEVAVARQVLDVVPAHDEAATLAVDVAELRVGDDDALEPRGGR